MSNDKPLTLTQRKLIQSIQETCATSETPEDEFTENLLGLNLDKTSSLEAPNMFTKELVDTLIDAVTGIGVVIDTNNSHRENIDKLTNQININEKFINKERSRILDMLSDHLIDDGSRIVKVSSDTFVIQPSHYNSAYCNEICLNCGNDLGSHLDIMCPKD